MSLADKTRGSKRCLAKELRQSLAGEDAEEKVQARGNFIPIDDRSLIHLTHTLALDAC